MTQAGRAAPRAVRVSLHPQYVASVSVCELFTPVVAVSQTPSQQEEKGQKIIRSFSQVGSDIPCVDSYLELKITRLHQVEREARNVV